MTLVDLIKDLIDNTKERLKTPISSAFLWSFIVFNWRPIILLLFSNETIENKIIVINHEYCTFWAIFLPALFALLYTSLVPKLMLAIDNDLAPTKEKRVTNIYKEKDHLFDKKIEIARKEFLLKNTESGNREMEELLHEKETFKEKIVILQETIKQIENSNKITIEQLNNNLQNSNKTIENLVNQVERLRINEEVKDLEFKEFSNLRRNIIANTMHLSNSYTNEILLLVERLTFDDFRILMNIKLDANGKPIVDLRKSDNDVGHILIEKDILILRYGKGTPEVYFTKEGEIIYDTIKRSIDKK